jgi:cobalt-zinc-cadmium efflux system protein
MSGGHRHDHDHDHDDHGHDHCHGHGGHGGHDGHGHAKSQAPASAHSHAHGHAHAHAPADFSTAFAIGIALNLVFVAVEAFYGWKVDSLALLADAGHNLSDVAGLVLAWAAAWAAKRRATPRYTYGWQRGSILAAFTNAVLLLLAVGALALEAVHRFRQPVAPPGMTVIVVAAIGIAINTGTALMFLRGAHAHGDMNVRGAFLHMAADALVSLGVVLGGLLMLWKGWAWVDPLLSVLIGAVIVVGTWGLFKQSLHLLFDGVPAGIDMADLRLRLQALPGVAEVHDLHVWAMGSTHNALTAHLVLAADATAQGPLLRQAEQMLQQRFGIRHSTLQLETPQAAADCGLRHGADCGQASPGSA